MLNKNDDIKKVEITLHTDNGVYTYRPNNYVVLFEGDINGNLGLIGSADILDINAAKLFVCKLMDIVQSISDSVEKEKVKKRELAQNAMWAFPYFANDDLEGLRKDPHYDKADKDIRSAIEKIIIENKKGDN
jgi:hypothetical protein